MPAASNGFPFDPFGVALHRNTYDLFCTLMNLLIVTVNDTEKAYLPVALKEMAGRYAGGNPGLLFKPLAGENA